jgi:hypothetical protein
MLVEATLLLRLLGPWRDSEVVAAVTAYAKPA